MGSAEGKIEQERVLRSLAGDELRRFTGQQFGHVGRFFENLRAVTPEVMEDLAGRRSELIVAMRVRIEPARIPAEELVETLG